MKHRAKALGDHAVEVPNAVWAARHQAQKPAARYKSASSEILDLPPRDLLDPIGKLRGAFGRARGATGFEDAGDRRWRPVPAGDEVVDGDTAQFVDEIGKPAQVREGLHL